MRKVVLYSIYFNPRSYKRSDDCFFLLQCVIPISIHAPTRGATSSAPFCFPAMLFQSTLLQEERLVRQYSGFSYPNFNPRSYKRSDAFITACLIRTDISIHAPTRGATATYLRSAYQVQFQSTLLQEERQQKCTIFLILICNNYCIVSIKLHQHCNNYFM